MVKEIPLTQGYIALVDDEDFDRVSQFKWSATSKNRKIIYARAWVGNKYGYRDREYLHRFIMNAGPEIEIDHKDSDGLNCTRDNIRSSTRGQNAWNRRLLSSNTSGFKGVSRYTQHGPRFLWRAIIYFQGKQITLGYFAVKEDAAIAYDTAARALYGEFSRLNFPGDGEQSA